MSATGFPARLAAARLLSGVLDARTSLAEQIAAKETPLGGLVPSERARAQALATRTLRHLGRIDAFLSRFLDRSPPRPARNALRLATAEVHLDRIPAHAAVDAAVNLARTHPKSRHLTGLVNAVARRSAAAAEIWAETPEAALPGWIGERLSTLYGAETAQTIATVHTAEPPLDLTVKRPEEIERLVARLEGECLPTGSIRLRVAGQVSALPGFAEGAWWVQDAAAALPARLLGDVSGLRVLDLCAAPGGKALQFAAAGADVVSLDISETRLTRLRENLARTGLSAEIIAADALDWAPETSFDAILLDAPCSATGTIRRHPDLPHVRQPDDVESLARLQSALLFRAWDWLKPGGRLVYCTCSILPEEGADQIVAFLARTPDARQIRPEPGPLGIDSGWLDPQGGLRLRPDYWAETGGMDGFFAAVLQKM